MMHGRISLQVFIIYIYSANNPTFPDYLPGLERPSLYKEIWHKYWPEFLSIYNEKFKEKYGTLTHRKRWEVEKLLGCGNFENGFKLFECSHCGIKLAVPFSCKSRLCLSCYRKKLFGWSMNLSKVLDPSLRHQHIVYTLPGHLRNILFKRKFNPYLLNKLSADLYQRAMRKAVSKTDKKWKPGIMTSVHVAGNGLNYNPLCGAPHN